MARRGTPIFLRAIAEVSEIQLNNGLRRNSNKSSIRHLSSCGVLATQTASLSNPPRSCQITPSRSVINLATPLIARRMEYSETRSLEYSTEQMFDIVASVDQYHQFVPWCKNSKVKKGRNGDVQALLEIGFPPFVERYVSDVTVIPNHQVRAVCIDGSLFSHLETLWRFSPGSPDKANSCDVEFYVSFEFKSLLHAQLATVFFDEVVKQMVNAFEMRAAKLYNCEARGQQNAARKRTAQQ